MVRAVFDTNIFLRALINPRSHYGRLLSSLTPYYVLVLSPAIIREILEVLHRPTLRDKFPAIKEIGMSEIISILEKAEVVEPQDQVEASRDPKDNMFLACAKEGRAAYLVSQDKDLLSLRQFQGVEIVDVGEFVAVIEP